MSKVNRAAGGAALAGIGAFAAYGFVDRLRFLVGACALAAVVVLFGLRRFIINSEPVGPTTSCTSPRRSAETST